MVFEEILPICTGKTYQMAITALLVSCALIVKPDLKEDQLFGIVGPMSDQLVTLVKMAEMPATNGVIH